MKLRCLALLGAMLAICCEDNRPVYPLGAVEGDGGANAGQGGGGAANAPEAGQSAGGAGGRIADAG